jgi:hypothetical protein
MGFKSSLESFQKVREAVLQEKKKVVTENNYGNDLFFKPALVKNEEKTKFKIRFLEVAESPIGKPWIQINYHMFERQGDNKYIKVIDPRTFDPKAENPIADRAKALFDSENALDKKMGSVYYRKPRYFCFVYIKEAPENQKDLVGKVLIYEAGVKIYNKLKAAIDDQELCFYDAFAGRDFALIMRPNPTNEKWPNYDDSLFIGSDCPISNDKAKMEEISAALDKLSIKSTILAKDPIKSGAELKELLEGGTKPAGAKSEKSSRPAQDLVSGKAVSTTAGDVDFGTDDVVHTPAAKPTEKKVEATKAPEKKVEAKVESTETDVPADEFNVNFSDEDFK